MEFLDILNENGEYAGKIEERKAVHNNGLWHVHVGVWIMNKDFRKNQICDVEKECE